MLCVRNVQTDVLSDSEALSAYNHPAMPMVQDKIWTVSDT